MLNMIFSSKIFCYSEERTMQPDGECESETTLS